jgi:hypothetical protein
MRKYAQYLSMDLFTFDMYETISNSVVEVLLAKLSSAAKILTTLME